MGIQFILFAMLFDMEAEVLAREGKFGRFNSNRNNGYRELCRAVAENYSCLTFEEYLNNFKKEYPFESVLARIFRVYGRSSRDVISRWVRMGLRGELIEVFLKENSFDYIFSEDVAEGLLRLAENNKARGIVNLGSGESRKIEEVVKIIKKQIPSLKIKEITKKNLFEASCADISRLKKLTGWEPTITLEQGIKMIINYEIKQKGENW